MSNGAVATLRTAEDIARFEAELPLEARLPGRSVFDVFVAGAQRQPEGTALTMLMSGAPDEQPRRASYAQLLGLVRRAANLFATLGGPRPGVAYMLPSLVETHATLWGAETAGYAVPINFLLQPAHIAELLEASGARILVALGPHPQLDIWQKALQVGEQLPGLTLVRVAPPGTPAEAGVVDFHAELMTQPDDRLTFGEPTRTSVRPGTCSRSCSAFCQVSSCGCGPRATRIFAPEARSNSAMCAGCSRKLIGTA